MLGGHAPRIHEGQDGIGVNGGVRERDHIRLERDTIPSSSKDNIKRHQFQYRGWLARWLALLL